MAKQWHQLERLDHKALKKLQQEREKAAKLAAQKAENQKKMIVGGVILALFIGVIVLTLVIKKKIDISNLEKAKDNLKYSSVKELSGTPEFKTTGDWQAFSSEFTFKDNYTFRTTDESHIILEFPSNPKKKDENPTKNTIKLYPPNNGFPATELTVKTPLIEVKDGNPLIAKQIIEMAKGEVTVNISVDGKDLLFIQVANITIIGQTSMFKIKYDEDKEKGEVVVKNGLVEVKVTGSSESAKLTGFYKVSFEQGELGTPTQASIIQYDWR